MHETSFPAK